jgi:hypothetical protein
MPLHLRFDHCRRHRSRRVKISQSDGGPLTFMSNVRVDPLVLVSTIVYAAPGTSTSPSLVSFGSAAIAAGPLRR